MRSNNRSARRSQSLGLDRLPATSIERFIFVHKFDYLIIGGGMAGASAGYFLADHGSVALLEMESQPGYHTTGRSAAFYAQSYGNAAIRALTVGCKSFFDAPPPGFTDQPLLSDCGALFVARDDQMDSLHAHFEETRALIPDVQLLTKQETRDWVPALREDYVAGGLKEPRSMSIDVHALHHGFLRGFREKGGVIATDNQVIGLGRTNGDWLAESRSGTYAAPVVINAAGAWCDQIGQLAGAQPIGLVPKRRTVIVFDNSSPHDSDSWPLTVDVDEQFYLKPDSGRILGSPANEDPMAPCDVQPEDIDIATAMDRLQKATTLEITSIVNKWAGLRSFVADKSPVVGFDPDAPGFFWLAGQGGYGIQTAPSMGLVSALLASGRDFPSHLVDLGLTAADLSPQRLREVD